MKQFVPRRSPDGIRLESFELDIESLVDSLPFARKNPTGLARLKAEIADMATHMPRWLLTLSSGRQRMSCPSCRGLLIFERGLRCAACGKTVARRHPNHTARACWFGLLPPIGLSGLRRFDQALTSKRAPDGHVLAEQTGMGRFLLVPLLAGYPDDYPRSPPLIRYLPGFFELPHMPPDQASHQVHLYGQGVLCLFASGQWQRKDMIRTVIEQRAYAHVIKMLNFANGKSQAFAKVS